MSVTAGITYQMLLKNIVKLPTAQRSLNNLLRLNSVDWTKVYMLPRQVTIESSLRSFQYKILNNILYLNEKLFKLKIVASPLCSLCKLHNETTIHLFSTCRVTLTLWEQLRSWISETGILLPESMEPQHNHIRSMERKDTRLCNYYLLTRCKGRTRKYKPKVFHTARACEDCLENLGLVFLGTARAPS